MTRRVRFRASWYSSGHGPRTDVAVVGTSLAGLRAAETLRREGFDGRDRRDRRRAAPALRPAAALEGAAARATGSPTDIVLRKQGVDDLDLDWRLGRARDRARRRRARGRARRRRTRRVRRARASRPARRRGRFPDQPDLDGRVHAAHARRRARAPRAARRAAQGRRDRRRVHRRRGRGHVPGPRPRRHRARGAAAADGARPRPGARRGDRRRAPRPRRRPPHRRAGRGDRRRRRGSSGRAPRRRLDRRRRRRGRRRRCRARDRLARGSGLTLDNGVVCDETCLAAPGDRRRGRRRPLAQPALRRRARCGSSTGPTRPSRACTAARRLLAGDDGEPFAPVPFVWSDQYDRKIQTVGRRVGPTPTCTSRTARSRSGSSSRSSAATAGSSARSASTGPAW